MKVYQLLFDTQTLTNTYETIGLDSKQGGSGEERFLLVRPTDGMRATGHSVHCMDFSRVALGQLQGHADRQGLTHLINPLHFDANEGKLPEEIDAFYARSALHVADGTLLNLLGDVDDHMREKGIIVIEGKSATDCKIARSVDMGNGLAVDPEENGHMRRVWTPEGLESICTKFGWTALNQSTVGEEWAGTDATFLRLIAEK